MRKSLNFFQSWCHQITNKLYFLLKKQVKSCMIIARGSLAAQRQVAVLDLYCTDIEKIVKINNAYNYMVVFERWEVSNL